MRTQWNDEEDEAMDYLPHIDQIIYLRGIRRRMDYQTGLAGMTAAISYDWLSQLAEVHPERGSKVKAPQRLNKEALRAIFARLERAGLIERLRDHGARGLVFRCLLADRGSSVSGRNNPRTTPEQPHTNNPETFSNGAAGEAMNNLRTTLTIVPRNNPIQETDNREEEANASLSEAVASDGGKPASACPHQDIIALYHDTLPELPGIVASRWTGSKDATALQARWREDKRHQSLEFWQRFFAVVRTNPHWMGSNDRGWSANLRWLVKRENFDKVIDRMACQREVSHG